MTTASDIHDSGPDPAKPSNRDAAEPGPDGVLAAARVPVNPSFALDEVRTTCPVRVVRVDGDDALAERLRAAGLWPGTVVERITAAPFGDPVLFRLHGYRLALRRDEANRVQVVECVA